MIAPLHDAAARASGRQARDNYETTSMPPSMSSRCRRLALPWILSLAVLGGCASVDATRVVLQMLKVSNPVNALLAELFLEPLLVAMQDTFARYALKARERLPESVVATIDFAVQTRATMNALKRDTDTLKLALKGSIAAKDELERRVLGLQRQAKPPAELAGLTRELAEKRDELKRQTDTLAAKNRELESLRTKYAAERRQLQQQLNASERSRKALQAKQAELLAALNGAQDIAQSPVKFVDGDAWNEGEEYVSGVQISEREFDRVDWADFAFRGRSAWDERIKPVEIALQQKAVIDAGLLAAPGEEFSRLQQEIRQKLEAEGRKYRFSLRRTAN